MVTFTYVAIVTSDHKITESIDINADTIHLCILVLLIVNCTAKQLIMHFCIVNKTYTMSLEKFYYVINM